jgi:hypothetical protein
MDAGAASGECSLGNLTVIDRAKAGRGCDTRPDDLNKDGQDERHATGLMVGKVRLLLDQ